MKRITIMALLCAIVVFAFAACNPDAHEHSYSTDWSSDATNHWHACSCGEKSDVTAHADADNNGKCDVCNYELSHNHAYSTDWSSDATNHWHACSCGEKSDVAAHADADFDGKCDVCGFEVGHEHSFSTDWSSDAANHWQVCACGEKSGEAAHVDNDNNGLCDVCNYDLGHEHSYSADWSTDATNHWHACSCGEKSDVAAHADADFNGKCDVCGFEVGHEHSFSTDWSSDATNHWHVCGCGEKTNVAVHIDVNYDGKCDVCNYEVGHDHVYSTDWSSDATNHWQACVCGDKTGVAAHVDANYDGKCDVCDYEVGHDHVYGEEWASDENFHWHACVCGKEDKLERHIDSDFNEICDTCGASYRDPSNFFANILSGSGFIENIGEMETGYCNVTINFPSAGTYIIDAPAVIDGFEEKMEIIAPGDEYSMYTPYTYVAEEAGEVEFVFAYFAWSPVSRVDFEYNVTKVYDIVLKEGVEYIVPAGVTITVHYELIKDGMYQFTNDYGTAILWNEYYDKFDYVATGVAGDVITFTINFMDTTEDYYVFTCDVNEVPAEGEKINIGSNGVDVVPNGYTPVTFVAPKSGVYQISLPEGTAAAFYYEAYGSLHASYDLVQEIELAEGDSVTYYVAELNLVEAYETSVEVEFIGVYVAPDTETEDTTDYIVSTGNDPVENIYVYGGYEECEAVFTAGSDVLMSFDGGSTWVSSYTVPLGYYDSNDMYVSTVVFLVKNATDSGATSARINIENIVYTFTANVGENEAVTLIPGKEYTLTIEGLMNYYSDLTITWDNPAAIVTVGGVEYVAGDPIYMYNTWWVTITVTIPTGAESNSIAFTITDLNDVPEGGEEGGDVESENVLILGSNSVYVEDGFNGVEYVFTAPVTGNYQVVCVDSNSYNTIEDAYGSSTYFAGDVVDCYLEAGETLTVIVATNSATSDTIEIDIILPMTTEVGDGSTSSPYTIVESGTYTSDLAEGAVAYYAYTAEADCDITLSAHGSNYYIQYGTFNFMLMSDNLNPEWQSTATVSLAAGETLFIGVSSYDMEADVVDLSVTVSAAEDEESEGDLVLEEGTNSITLVGDSYGWIEPVYYTFTAGSAGTYRFSSGEGEINLYAILAVWNEGFADYEVDYNYEISSEGSFDLTLEEGETVTILISTDNGDDDTVELDITKIS